MIREVVSRTSHGLFMGGLLLAWALVGCRGEGEEASPLPEGQADVAEWASSETIANPLAGTDWRLVEIQSMDDAQGITRPEDPSLFTMKLNEDGSVNLRLDCNRANGTWTAEMGPDESSGRFEFGALAGTRALCPPPNLDEEITSQAPYIRSFLLQEGRLYLSLMADGGIWVWEPRT